MTEFPEAAKSEDPEYERIVREVWRLVYAVALHLLGDHDDAEDAAQQVLVKLHRDFCTRIPAESRERYLVKAVEHEAISMLRVRKRVSARMVPLSPLLSANLQDSTLSPLGRAARERALELLDGMIERLPERCRDAARLICREGLSHTEVARRLDVSSRAVAKQASRFRRLLWQMPEAPRLEFWLCLWLDAYRGIFSLAYSREG